jgi:hypothetical protein
MDFDNNNNKWDSDENDTDYEDEEYVQNEVPPPEINKDFIENILKVKHSLYDNVVLSPELGTEKAQNNTILQDYLHHVNQVYILAINAQRSKVKEQDLQPFPEKSRDEIRKTLDWITDYYKKNQVPDTIPYTDFIRKSFHEYQFVQNDNSFE